MEVHHHPHVEKKNFKEYFLEFLMIFLAVTLGFFAENIRENIVDNQKELHYIKSIVGDVGGFIEDFYWSSSEHGSQVAWIVSFQTGLTFIKIKKKQFMYAQ